MIYSTSLINSNRNTQIACSLMFLHVSSEDSPLCRVLINISSLEISEAMARWHPRCVLEALWCHHSLLIAVFARQLNFVFLFIVFIESTTSPLNGHYFVFFRMIQSYEQKSSWRFPVFSLVGKESDDFALNELFLSKRAWPKEGLAKECQ